MKNSLRAKTQKFSSLMLVFFISFIGISVLTTSRVLAQDSGNLTVAEQAQLIVTITAEKDRIGCNDGGSNKPAICGRSNEEIIALCQGTGITQAEYPGNTTLCEDLRVLPGFVASTESAPTCEERADSVFSFVLCPLLGGLNNTIEALDDQINDLLFLDRDYYDNPEVREVWATIRNIALILLIPIMLMMVIGTALNMNFLDPYTVKRAMPRLFVAIIFIILSFDICRIMVEVTNGVSQGLVGIIAQPFGGVKELTLEQIFTPVAGVNKGTAMYATGVLIGLGSFLLGAVTLPIILSFIVGLFVAYIAAYFTLVVRQIILIFLIILSPVAIISWIFPGNDKLWKLWWGSFNKLLLLYIVIIGLMITGRVFAVIVNDAGVDGFTGIITKIIAIIATIALIPKVFTFAGGAFANIAGMANDRSRGFFDRNRQFRANNRKAAMERARTGNRFKGNSKLAESLNTTAGLAHQVKNLNPTLSATDARNQLQSGFAMEKERAAHEFSEKNPWFNYYAEDDSVLGAALKARLAGGSKADFEKAILESNDERFVTATPRMAQAGQPKNEKGQLIGPDGEPVYDYSVSDEQRSNQSRVWGYVAKSFQQSGKDEFGRAAIPRLAKDGTYYKDAADLAEHIVAVYGDDRQGAGAAMMTAAGHSLNAGRGDIGAAGAGAKLGLLGEVYKIDKQNQLASRGESPVPQGGKVIKREEVQEKFIQDVLDSQPASVLVHPSMKKSYLEKNIIPVMKKRLLEKHNASTQADYELETNTDPSKQVELQTNALKAKKVLHREYASIDNLHQSLSGTSPQLAGLYGDEVLDMELPPTTVTVDTGITDDYGNRVYKQQTKTNNVRQAVGEAEDDPTFQLYRQQFISAEKAEENRRSQYAAAQQAQKNGVPVLGNPIMPKIGDLN